MKIPVAELKYGIIRCLYSSTNIKSIAEIIFNQYKKELSKGGTSINPKYSVILFYYAVEELGKAIIIEELMKKANESGVTEITVKNFFGNHDEKISKAHERYSDLIIQKLVPEVEVDPKPVKLEELSFSEWYNLIPSGDIIPNFTDRSNLWLTTFDESKNKWLEPIDDFDEYELNKKIELLSIIIKEWQEKYHN